MSILSPSPSGNEISTKSVPELGLIDYKKLGDEAQSKVREVQAKIEELKLFLDPEKHKLRKEIKKLLEHKSSIGDGKRLTKFLNKIHIWAAVCLAGMALGHLLGRYILSIFLEFILDELIDLGVTFVPIPAWLFFYNRKVASDDDKRFLLLGLAVMLGVLGGYNSSLRHTQFFAPPAFLLPVTIGSALQGPKFASDRKLCLSVTVASAAGVYLFFGLLNGSMGFFYIMRVIWLCCAAAIQLQLVLGHLRLSKDKSKNNAQSLLLPLFSAVLIQSLLFYLLGYQIDRDSKQKLTSSSIQQNNFTESVQQQKLDNSTTNEENEGLQRDSKGSKSTLDIISFMTPGNTTETSGNFTSASSKTKSTTFETARSKSSSYKTAKSNSSWD